VWEARYKVYGNVVQYEVEAVENNIRFQGQYFDAETGLHYNRNRYYHPVVGRFITVDPVGLLGGNNNYEYAPNPIAWVDPLGLSCKEALNKRLDRLGYDAATKKQIMNAVENGNPVVIVGENMKRVNAVANMVNKAGGKAVTYAPRNWNGVSRNSLEANRSWIRYWAKEKQSPIIDIGRQPTPREFGPSPFYGIENRSLNRWGVYTPFSE